MCTFGSTKNGLACKDSDLDVTLLLTSYLPDNEHKQQVMPKIVSKQLNRSKQNSKNSDSSNSNSTHLDEEDDEDNNDLVMEDVSEQHVENSTDSNLKECVVKFFVS